MIVSLQRLTMEETSSFVAFLREKSDISIGPSSPTLPLISSARPERSEADIEKWRDYRTAMENIENEMYRRDQSR
ncbi:MAG TPA: hypothetical protein PLZ42_02335 [Methanothrix sp.]|nr:hypothetical protein [Methanothrix sp.]